MLKFRFRITSAFRKKLDPVLVIKTTRQLLTSQWSVIACAWCSGKWTPGSDAQYTHTQHQPMCFESFAHAAVNTLTLPLTFGCWGYSTIALWCLHCSLLRELVGWRNVAWIMCLKEIHLLESIDATSSSFLCVNLLWPGNVFVAAGPLRKMVITVLVESHLSSTRANRVGGNKMHD